VKISEAKIQRLGVRSVPVRAARSRQRGARRGEVEVDERRLATITPKFEGYVEKLFVNATGQSVAARGRCSRPTARSCSPRSASTPSPRRGWRKLKGSDEATVAGMKAAGPIRR